MAVPVMGGQGGRKGGGEGLWRCRMVEQALE